MSLVSIRKTQVTVDEIWRDRGPAHEAPLRVGCALAVVANPYADRYVEDVIPFMADLRDLGHRLSKMLIEALGGADQVEAYGKGAIVGEGGDLETGALWHEAGGWALREALGGPKAIVPSAKTVGGLGARLIVPLGHIHAAYVRSHMSATQMTVWDGPRRDEIVYGLVAATGPRIENRCGGLQASDIKDHDGQR